MVKEVFSVSKIVSEDGCFDLQFRKDTRKERTNSPTYYRWKLQFVVTSPKGNGKVLEKIKKELKCGEVSLSRGQARFSVQKIDDIAEIIVPFFKKNNLTGEKKKDFELWAKGVEVVQKNKRKALAEWKKSELNSLIQIYNSSEKYKKRVRSPKWLDMAKTLAKTA